MIELSLLVHILPQETNKGKDIKVAGEVLRAEEVLHEEGIVVLPESKAAEELAVKMVGEDIWRWAMENTEIAQEEDSSEFYPKVVDHRKDAVVKMSNACDKAIEVAVRYGGSAEPHHLLWIIDQMVRHLAGDEGRYNEIVRVACASEDGTDESAYEWHVGIAP